MPKDLTCPLGTNCKIYQTHLDVNSDYLDIIKGAADGYSCRALYRANSPKPDKEKKGECALIELLNNTDTLLKLNGKENL